MTHSAMLLLPLLAAVILLGLAQWPHPCQADQSTHIYQDAEPVVVFASKTGPYHNPSETYPFYSLPLCPPMPVEQGRIESASTFGVLLEGDLLVDTGMRLPFKRDHVGGKLCDLKMTEAVAAKLTNVVKEHYWYTWYIDELPVFGMIGEYISEEEMRAELAQLTADQSQGQGAPDASTPVTAQAFLYTHRDISISYNGHQVIEVNLTSENPRPIKVGEVLPMTYSISWTPTQMEFEKRFERYLAFDFLETNVHSFALLNSFMMVLFLCALVLLVLNRTLKTSIGGASMDVEMGSGVGTGGGVGSPSYRSVPSSPRDDVLDESGWKMLTGDVFRSPNGLIFFAALIGTGFQLLLLAVALLLLAAAAALYEERGLLTLMFLIVYSITSLAQGYLSGYVYKIHGGLNWQRALFLTATLYPGLLLFLALFMNALAMSMGAHAFLAIKSFFLLLLIWICVSLPLTIIGTLWARSQTQKGAFPCRVNAIPRAIPSETRNHPSAAAIKNGIQYQHQQQEPMANNVPTLAGSQWYTSWYLLVAMSGLLPFGAIFIECYFVLTSFWNYKYYYVYGFLCLVFLILLVVCACVSIVSTYILLNAEDHRWHWLSFLSGCSASFYLFLYCIYFYWAKTSMQGWLQSGVFFAYALGGCATLGLITGAVGALSARVFVTKIYSFIKSD